MLRWSYYYIKIWTQIQYIEPFILLLTINAVLYNISKIKSTINSIDFIMGYYQAPLWA
jgi:hypothetical protein